MDVGELAPLASAETEHFRIIDPFLAFLSPKKVKFLVVTDAPKLRTVGRKAAHHLPVKGKQIQLYHIVGLFIEPTHKVNALALA